MRLPPKTRAAEKTAMPASRATSPPRPAVTAAQPRVREDLLHEDRAAKDLADRGELQREGGQRQVAQAVVVDRLPHALTAGPGKAHVVALEHVDGLLARVQGDVGHADDREREGRQHHVVQGLGKGHIGG